MELGDNPTQPYQANFATVKFQIHRHSFNH
jgi:hypothetical protein